jgi:hypothetical protein
MTSPPVVVTVVPDEAEAEVVCGRLRAEGIPCGHRPSPLEAARSAVSGFGASAPVEVCVAEEHLEAARAVVEG